MTTLLNGRDTKITGGEYVYQAIVTTGDITLSMRLDDNAFTPIPDGVISATESKVITLPECILKADYSGDGVFSLGIVRSR